MGAEDMLADFLAWRPSVPQRQPGESDSLYRNRVVIAEETAVGFYGEDSDRVRRPYRAALCR